MVMDAIRNPHKERPQGEAKLGEIARQYVTPPYPFRILHHNIRRTCVCGDRRGF